MGTKKLPFSVRTRASEPRIHGTLPASARIAFVHVIHKAVQSGWIGGWIPAAEELARVARRPPRSFTNYDGYEDYEGAEKLVVDTIQELEWSKVFDFMERLHDHLAEERRTAGGGGYGGSPQVGKLVQTKETAQEMIEEEISAVLLEEHLDYFFRDGEFGMEGKAHTNEMLVQAGYVLGDSRLGDARGHFNKAISYLRNARQPDYPNAVKEAMCAVEATAAALFEELRGKSLGEMVKMLSGKGPGDLHPALGKTIAGLWGYRSSAAGVGHGSSGGPPVTKATAEYVLSVSAAQVILLVEMAAENQDNVPF